MYGGRHIAISMGPYGIAIRHLWMTSYSFSNVPYGGPYLVIRICMYGGRHITFPMTPDGGPCEAILFSYVCRRTYEVWSKISGTKFLKEKLLVVSKWQPCRILGNISWRHIPEERMVAWLSREWVDLQCNCVCPSVVLWNGCVERATCLHQVLPETWWDGHRNVRNATTSIRRNRVESVQDMWVVFTI
jgi:hypothetical protein